MAKKYFKSKARAECLDVDCECLKCMNIADLFESFETAAPAGDKNHTSSESLKKKYSQLRTFIKPFLMSLKPGASLGLNEY